MLLVALGTCVAQIGVLPSAVLAMSGGGVRIDFDRTVLIQVVIFSALIVVLKPLLFDPVLRVFEERERRTEGARAEARQMQEDAGELLREYERALDRVRRTAAEERERVRAETSKLEAEILNQGHTSAAEILADGRARVRGEVEVLKRELARSVQEVTRELVTTAVRRETGR